MANEEFLSRWSRRKQAGEKVRVAEDEVVTPKAMPGDVLAGDAMDSHSPGHPSVSASEESRPEPSSKLQSLETLTPQSDYKPFMQAGISSATRNAALKKLFTDPHFNVMDGLDTYIDDYTKSEPVPAEWLKTMWQSRGTLFSPEERVAAEADDARKADQAREAAAAEAAARLAAPAIGPVTHAGIGGSAGAANFNQRIQHDNTR